MTADEIEMDLGIEVSGDFWEEIADQCVRVASVEELGEGISEQLEAFAAFVQSYFGQLAFGDFLFGFGDEAGILDGAGGLGGTDVEQEMLDGAGERIGREAGRYDAKFGIEADGSGGDPNDAIGEGVLDFEEFIGIVGLDPTGNGWGEVFGESWIRTITICLSDADGWFAWPILQADIHELRSESGEEGSGQAFGNADGGSAVPDSGKSGKGDDIPEALIASVRAFCVEIGERQWAMGEFRHNE